MFKTALSLLIVLLMVSTQARAGTDQGLTVLIDNTPLLSPTDRPVVEEFVKETLALLPPSLKERVSKTVHLRFFKTSPAQTSDLVVAHRRLRIDLSLGSRPSMDPAGKTNTEPLTQALGFLLQPGQKLATHHKDTFTFAQATLIHELAHVYDSTPEQTSLARCPQNAKGAEHMMSLSGARKAESRAKRNSWISPSFQISRSLAPALGNEGISSSPEVRMPTSSPIQGKLSPSTWSSSSWTRSTVAEGQDCTAF